MQRRLDFSDLKSGALAVVLNMLISNSLLIDFSRRLISLALALALALPLALALFALHRRLSFLLSFGIVLGGGACWPLRTISLSTTGHEFWARRARHLLPSLRLLRAHLRILSLSYLHGGAHGLSVVTVQEHVYIVSHRFLRLLRYILLLLLLLLLLFLIFKLSNLLSKTVRFEGCVRPWLPGGLFEEVLLLTLLHLRRLFDVHYLINVDGVSMRRVHRRLYYLHMLHFCCIAALLWLLFGLGATYL